MSSFKFAKLSILSLMGSTILLTGCVKNKHVEYTTATFFVSRGPSGSATPVPASNSWALPDRTRFNITVCLADSAKKQPIQQQDFEIQGLADGKSVRLRTQPDGCLTWAEEMNFNYGAKPTFVTTERTVIAKGSHRGEAKVYLGLNPWSGTARSSAAAVLDLTVKNERPPAELLVADSLKALGLEKDSAGKLANQSKITLQTITLRFEDAQAERPVQTPSSPSSRSDQGGLTAQKPTRPTGRSPVKDPAPPSTAQVTRYPYNLIFRADPQLYMTDINGKSAPEKISTGRFILKLHLVAVSSGTQSGGPSQILLWESDAIPVAVDKQGSLNLSIPANVALPRDGKLQMGVQLIPFEAPQFVGEFSGVFGINNDVRSMAGDQTGYNLNPDGNGSAAKLHDLIQKSAPAGQVAGGGGQQVFNSPFFMDLITGGFYGSANCFNGDKCREKHYFRRVQATLSACPKRVGLGYSSYPVGHPFIIKNVQDWSGKIIDKSEPVRESNCLHWTDTFDGFPYSTEEFITREYTFVDAKNPQAQFKRTVYINAVDFFSTFLRDQGAVAGPGSAAEPEGKIYDVAAPGSTQFEAYMKSREKNREAIRPILMLEKLDLAVVQDPQNSDWNNILASVSGPQYTVNQDLDITVHKLLQFSTNSFSVKKESIRNGQSDKNPLRDGWYRLRVVALTSDSLGADGLPIPPFEKVMSAAELPVLVKGGSISQVLPLSFASPSKLAWKDPKTPGTSVRNFAMMGNQNLLLIKLDPIDEDRLPFMKAAGGNYLDREKIDWANYSPAKMVLIPQYFVYKPMTFIVDYVPQSYSRSAAVLLANDLDFDLMDRRSRIGGGADKKMRKGLSLKVRADTNLANLADHWFDVYERKQAEEKRVQHEFEKKWTDDPTLAAKQYAQRFALNYVEMDSPKLREIFEPKQKEIQSSTPINYDLLRRYLAAGSVQRPGDSPEPGVPSLTVEEEAQLRDSLCRFTTKQLYPTLPNPRYEREVDFVRHRLVRDSYNICLKGGGLVMQKNIHVGIVNPVATSIDASAFRSGVTTTLSRSLTESLSRGLGMTNMFNPAVSTSIFSLGGHWLEKLVVFVGPNFTGSMSKTDSTSNNHDSSASISKSLDGEELHVSLEPRSWQSCLAVFLTPGLLSRPSYEQALMNAPTERTRLYLCEQPRSQPTGGADFKITETYTWLTQFPPAETVAINLRDSYARIMVHLRGRSEYFKLRKILANSLQSVPDAFAETNTAMDLFGAVKSGLDYLQQSTSAPQVALPPKGKYPQLNPQDQAAIRNAAKAIMYFSPSFLYNLPTVGGVYSDFRSEDTLRLTNEFNSISLLDMLVADPLFGGSSVRGLQPGGAK